MYWSDRAGGDIINDVTAFNISSVSPRATDKEIRHEALSAVRLFGTSDRTKARLLATSINIAWRFCIIWNKKGKKLDCVKKKTVIDAIINYRYSIYCYKSVLIMFFITVMIPEKDACLGLALQFFYGNKLNIPLMVLEPALQVNDLGGHQARLWEHVHKNEHLYNELEISRRILYTVQYQ